MITGVVQNHQAVVPLVLHDDSGYQFTLDFVLDTGFDGQLTLTPSATAPLSLSLEYPVLAEMADGSMTFLDAVAVFVHWDGLDRKVRALVSSGDTLIGMSLLDGHDVHLEVTDGGLVSIEPL